MNYTCAYGPGRFSCFLLNFHFHFDNFRARLRPALRWIEQQVVEPVLHLKAICGSLDGFTPLGYSSPAPG